MPGCTVSDTVWESERCALTHFSLAGETDISAESYESPRIFLVAEGEMDVFATEGDVWHVQAGEGLYPPVGITVGMRTSHGCVYTEIMCGKEMVMRNNLTAGSVFILKDMLPYQDGKIVNMDLISGESLKFVLMSFDARTGLSEHAAPGEALIFALEGKAVIGYEGQEFPIQAGENFKFAKLGRHWIKADGRFKMALLLTLEP
ncbi:MAG: hypothetical protein IJU37_04130 [Desulfovibrio sp.]|nr:hypothetical protein [Desulfovibrio sp.]